MKRSILGRWITVAALSLSATMPSHAALPVVDVGAIAQLLQQILTLREQLSTARDQLREAQASLQSMTGSRGQENLLPAEPRNYLPADWRELNDVLASTSQQYRGLVTSLDNLVQQNAVLSARARATLSPRQQQALDRDRRSVALAQSVSRDALEVTSTRFASLGQLIAALPAARDPKAVWELQARIGAEQAMLENEQSKLTLLFETVRAEDAARRQQNREAAIRDIGRLQNLPPLGL